MKAVGISRFREPARASSGSGTASLALLAGLVCLSCDKGEFFGPPETRTFVISLNGQLVDGRDLREPGVAGQVAVLAADGVTPVMVDEDHIIETDMDGQFSVSFQADLTRPSLILQASASGPLLATRHAVAIDAGPVDVRIYLSSTLLSGRVLDPSGAPAVIDIWVMQDDGSGNFVPYQIAGGRDFIAPVPETGVRFGIDTDVLGGYAIPVRIPGGAFRLIFVVDTNTDRFNSFLTDIFVTGGVDNVVPTITLESASAPPQPLIGGGP